MNHTILDLEEKISHNVEYATFLTRVGAEVLDKIILWVANSLFVYLISEYLVEYMITIFSCLVLIVYKIYMEKEYGQTIGKILAHIKVEDDNLAPLTYMQVIKRNYYVFVSAAVSLLIAFNLVGKISFDATDSSTEVALQKIFHPANILLVLIYCIDCIAMIWNDSKKTVHDMFGQTIVVKLPS